MQGGLVKIRMKKQIYAVNILYMCLSVSGSFSNLSSFVSGLKVIHFVS